MNPVQGCTPLVDITHLNQIYFNLLSNAVKYTPERGTIRLHISETLAAKDKIRFIFTVSDNGIGMSREFQKHLFEPFSQEHLTGQPEMRGTGLGLAIVKKLLDLMGCEITVQSGIGKGTTFSLRGEFDCVPVSSVKIPGNKMKQNDLKRLAGRHVLLCEDHPLNQEIAKALLNENGIVTSIADDGQQGVKAFAESTPDFYAAILMDIHMPIMDGFEAAGAIRALKRQDAKTIPIIAMTADAFSDDVQKCLNAGMNDHIAKPIDPAKLMQVLNKNIS